MRARWRSPRRAAFPDPGEQTRIGERALERVALAQESFAERVRVDFERLDASRIVRRELRAFPRHGGEARLSRARFREQQRSGREIERGERVAAPDGRVARASADVRRSSSGTRTRSRPRIRSRSACQSRQALDARACPRRRRAAVRRSARGTDWTSGIPRASGLRSALAEPRDRPPGRGSSAGMAGGGKEYPAGASPSRQDQARGPVELRHDAIDKDIRDVPALLDRVHLPLRAGVRLACNWSISTIRRSAPDRNDVAMDSLIEGESEETELGAGGIATLEDPSVPVVGFENRPTARARVRRPPRSSWSASSRASSTPRAARRCPA